MEYLVVISFIILTVCVIIQTICLNKEKNYFIKKDEPSLPVFIELNDKYKSFIDPVAIDGISLMTSSDLDIFDDEDIKDGYYIKITVNFTCYLEYYKEKREATDRVYELLNIIDDYE